MATALRRAKQNIEAGLRSAQRMQLELGQPLMAYGVALG